MQYIEMGSENRSVTSWPPEVSSNTEVSRRPQNKNLYVLKSENAARLKELQRENTKLKRLVAELSLQKLTLRDLLSSKGL